MKRFILAALVVALSAPASDACFRGRIASRVRSVTRVVAKPVRSVVAAPVKAVASPCPGGVCPTPGK